MIKVLDVNLEIIFLGLRFIFLKGYNLSRRAHPLKEKTLLESIKREKEIFIPIKEISNLIIDTTKLRTIELEGIIKNNIHLSKK